jgi:hypothetical protein
MTYSKLWNPFAILLGQGCGDLVPMAQHETQLQLGGDGLLQLVQSELKLTPLAAPPGWTPARSPRGK